MNHITATFQNDNCDIIVKLRKRDVLSIFFLLLAGLFGNYLNIELFFGVNFIFGSIATIIAIYFYGAVWGVMVGIGVALYTYMLWGHPYAIIIFSLEALVISLALCFFKKDKLIIAAACFWIVIGIPLVIFFYSQKLNLPESTVYMIAAKQTINGLVNVILAGLIIHFTPLQKYLLGKEFSESKEWRMNVLSSDVLSACILLPMLVSMTVTSRGEFSTAVTNLETNVRHELQFISNSLSLDLNDSVRNLREVSEHQLTHDMVMLPNEKDSLLSSVIPEIISWSIFDKTGKLINSYNEGDDNKITIGDFKKSKVEQFSISDISTNTSNNRRFFSLLIPLQEENNLIVSIDANYYRTILSKISNKGDKFEVFDSSDNIVVDVSSLSLSNFVRHNNSNFLLPANPNLSNVARWVQAYWQYKVPYLGEWEISMARPMNKTIRELQNGYTTQLVIMTIIALSALLLTPLISRKLTEPLSSLTIASKLLVKDSHRTDVKWPESDIVEINSLVLYFQKMIKNVNEQQIQILNEQKIFNAFFDHSPSAVSVKNLNFEKSYVNNTWTHWFDDTQNNVSAEGGNLSKELKQRLIQQERKVIRTGDVQDYEFMLEMKNGEQLVLLLQNFPIRNSENQIERIGEICTDITELHKSRLEQKALADELSLLIETANAPIFGIDNNGKVNIWNKKTAELTGVSYEDALGKEIISCFVSSKHRTKVADILDNAIKGQHTINVELPLRSKEGKDVEILMNTATRKNADGQAIGIFGVGQDITERNMALKALKESEGRFLALIKASPVGIYIKDLDGHYIMISDTYKKWLGYGGEVIGKTIYDFAPESYAELCTKEDANLIKQLQVMEDEHEMLIIDRPSLFVHSVKFPILGADNEIIAIGGMDVDITQRKKNEVQIIQSSKLATLGEMATSVAHELNQPLNIIRMATANILRKIKADKIEKDYLTQKLTRIEQQTVRASIIIDHMRMFGRKSLNESSSLQLDSIVRSTMDLVREQLRLAGIEVKLEFFDSSPVIGDRIQLEQVLLNLLTNAKHAITTNPENAKIITIRVFEESSASCLTVQDTGPGIPETVLPRLFEPFFTTKEIGKGTGLGLSVSYGIINDMGGSITAENVSGGGALFKICFPHKDEDKG